MGKNNRPCSGKLVTISCFKPDTQNSPLTQEKKASKANHTMHFVRMVNKLETELLLCVKCCFISAGSDRRKYVRLEAEFQFYAGGAAIFATQWIFMPRSPPSRKRSKHSAVFFISLGSFGNYVDKNLSLPRRTTVYLIFLKKDYDICDRGVWAPDSSVLPCSLSCSVLIFFSGIVYRTVCLKGDLLISFFLGGGGGFWHSRDLSHTH